MCMVHWSWILLCCGHSQKMTQEKSFGKEVHERGLWQDLVEGIVKEHSFVRLAYFCCWAYVVKVFGSNGGWLEHVCSVWISVVHKKILGAARSSLLFKPIWRWNFAAREWFIWMPGGVNFSWLDSRTGSVEFLPMQLVHRGNSPTQCIAGCVLTPGGDDGWRLKGSAFLWHHGSY